MTFYEFNQNNSGGWFDVDDKLCHIVVIEADAYSEAKCKAEDIGIYFYGVDNERDCPCCGDRWDNYENKVDFKEFKTLEEYYQFMANEYGKTLPDVRIFYKNGEVKEIYKKINDKSEIKNEI
jgi:predicted NAD-dependent protein-ADP-ribosyltransferase YbiA (DUF1768 family)